MKTLLDREDLVFNPPELDCVLYLPGLPGGGNKIYDRSPYGNQGSITGATWVRLPSGLWCLKFDGQDDYVNCGSVITPTLTSPFTLEVWAMRVSESYNTIFDSLSGSTGFWCNITGYFDFRTNPGLVETWTGDIISQDVWYHLVVVLDGTTATLFVNGVEPSQTHADHSAHAAGNGILRISDASYYPFDGYIALPRIYRNRKLSSLEIQNHYN